MVRYRLKKKYAILSFVLASIGVVVIVLGSSYAFFTTQVSTKDYIVYTGNLQIDYTKTGNIVNLNNTYPMTNAQGLATTGYTFNITNNGTINARYQIRLELSNDNEIPIEYIKLAYIKTQSNSHQTDETITPILLSDLNSTLTFTSNQQIEATKTDSYNLKLWLDINTPNDIQRKTFKAKIVIEAIQDVEDGYAMANTSPIIILNKYANGNTDINLKVNEQFTDPEVLEIKDDKDKLTEDDITKTIEYTNDGVNLSTVNNVDTSVAGVYYITYTVTDSDNQTGTVVRVVTVNNTSAIPTISLNGSNSITVVEGEEYTELGVTVSSGNKVATIGEVKTSTLGTYILRYIVIDSNNNINSVTRTVTVVEKYRESILAGSYPVLTDNLVPITIDNNGITHKANLASNWYSYENKNWANAVVLEDKTQSYNVGDTIPESNIQSYFVWIPKYSYKLFNLGNYNSLTTLANATQEIEIKFGENNTANTSTTCASVTESGANLDGSLCSLGKYMTHPAFVAFENSKGFWAGKFETEYKDAASNDASTYTNTNSSEVIIKPNVYSWRNITVGNIFQTSYNYLRSEDSHMMKNTEWGAVAYLQHSKYGSKTSVRVNNNSGYVTGYGATEEPTIAMNTSAAGNRFESIAPGSNGTYTKPYNSNVGYLASTTGNITGVYDMSGGSWEYVAGYRSGTLGGSELIPTNYNNKYFDVYNASSINTRFDYRILGDATGELGPFQSTVDSDNKSRYKSSWYSDFGYFLSASVPWFRRGGTPSNGKNAGIFAFHNEGGRADNSNTFRIVLTPIGDN